MAVAFVVTSEPSSLTAPWVACWCKKRAGERGALDVVGEKRIPTLGFHSGLFGLLLMVLFPGARTDELILRIEILFSPARASGLEGTGSGGLRPVMKAALCNNPESDNPWLRQTSANRRLNLRQSRQKSC